MFRFDLVLTNLTMYLPADSSSNGLNGCLTRINVECDTSVELRFQVYGSCNTAENCRKCDQLATQAERDSCYANGCACFGVTCTDASCCTGQQCPP